MGSRGTRQAQHESPLLGHHRVPILQTRGLAPRGQRPAQGHTSEARRCHSNADRSSCGAHALYFCRPCPSLGLPCAKRAADFLQAPPQHPRDGTMDAGPMGGRCDMPTHPRTDPQLMELLLGGAAPSGQAPRQADGWAIRPTTRTLTAVLQGQQGASTAPHSVIQQTQA